MIAAVARCLLPLSDYLSGAGLTFCFVVGDVFPTPYGPASAHRQNHLFTAIMKIAAHHAGQELSLQKRLERELGRETQAPLSRDVLSVLDSIPDAILCCDVTGVIQQANQAVTTVLGYSTSALIGERVEQVLPQFDRKKIPETVHDVYRDELTALTYAKDQILVGLSATSRQEGEGPSAGFTLVIRDVTWQKEAERQRTKLMNYLNEARKLEAIGTLASGVAHEINTPIQYIGDNVQFMADALGEIHQAYLRYKGLADRAQADDVYQELLVEIDSYNRSVDLNFLIDEIPKAALQSLEGVQQVRQIIQAMRDVSHPGAEEFVPLDLNYAVENAITICRNKLKHAAEITKRLDQSLPKVPCLGGPIQQVLLNILINAAHAIEDAGRDDGRISVETCQTTNHVRIKISDNGIGIPLQIRERIFDPFFTTKPVGKGTGQGLSLAYDVVVQRHGGDIHLFDEPGMATSFVVELPKVRPEERDI